MAALLVGCYALCAALVLFAEQVICPRSAEPVDADLTRTDPLEQSGKQ
jgi:hypothetical protein